MLCFFMLFLMIVSSAPLGLMHGKHASKHVTEMMSHPHLSQALFQNKIFLSELAEADSETLNTILGLLNGLLNASEAASLKFNTDVATALADKDAKSNILAAAVLNQTQSTTAKNTADLALEAADLAKTEATSNFDATVLHHTAMVNELNDKQPGVDAETATLEDTIALIETLLPETEWLLIIRSHLGSYNGGGASNGDLAAGGAGTDNQGNFKIDKTGAELYSEGYDQVRVTIDGLRQVIFNGTIDTRGFDNTCATCNCLGNSIGAGLFWHGGRGHCNGGSHYGIATSDDVHVTCNGGLNAYYGHFHRGGVNTGVYAYGKGQDNCVSENEWDTTMEYWLKRSA